MTAGLPGSGLGGLFYLIASLAIPLRELWLVARGDVDRARMRLAWRQFAVAAGIVAAVWLSDSLVRPLLPLVGGSAGAAGTDGPGSSLSVPLLVALGILSAVLMLVELLALLARRGSSRRSTIPAKPWSDADGTAPV